MTVFRVAAACVVATSFITNVDVRADDAVVPRYSFQVGERLRFEGDYDFQYDEIPDRAFGDRIETTVWILDERNDGWQMLLHTVRTPYYVRKGEKEEQEPSSSLATFALSKSGRITMDAAAADFCHRFGLRLEEYFPRLPDGAQTARDGWESSDPRLRRRYRYEFASESPNTSGQVTIGVEAIDPMDAIVLANQHDKVVFDLRRGRLIRAESKYVQKYGHLGTGTLKIRLTDQDRIGAAEAARLLEQTRIFSKACGEYFATFRRAREATNSKTAERHMAEGKTALTTAKEAVGETVFRKVIESLLAEQRERKREISLAERRGEKIGSAAPTWTLDDLDGDSHSLAGQRGKVVVLDFWYRGCGPCIAAMPQMIELSKRFSGRPVAVFGMNTDQDANDARFVSKAMKLNYPTLLVGETDLVKKSGNFGFPTLIVIDQQGVIRHIHNGYSTDLAERTAEVIEGLLDKN